MVGDLAGDTREPKGTRGDLNCTVHVSHMRPSWRRQRLDFLQFYYTSRNTTFFDYFKYRSSIWKKQCSLSKTEKLLEVR